MTFLSSLKTKLVSIFSPDPKTTVPAGVIIPWAISDIIPTEELQEQFLEERASFQAYFAPYIEDIKNN